MIAAKATTELTEQHSSLSDLVQELWTLIVSGCTHAFKLPLDECLLYLYPLPCPGGASPSESEWLMQNVVMAYYRDENGDEERAKKEAKAAAAKRYLETHPPVLF